MIHEDSNVHKKIVLPSMFLSGVSLFLVSALHFLLSFQEHGKRIRILRIEVGDGVDILLVPSCDGVRGVDSQLILCWIPCQSSHLSKQ